MKSKEIFFPNNFAASAARPLPRPALQRSKYTCRLEVVHRVHFGIGGKLVRIKVGNKSRFNARLPACARLAASSRDSHPTPRAFVKIRIRGALRCRPSTRRQVSDAHPPDRTPRGSRAGSRVARRPMVSKRARPARSTTRKQRQLLTTDQPRGVWMRAVARGEDVAGRCPEDRNAWRRPGR